MNGLDGKDEELAVIDISDGWMSIPGLVGMESVPQVHIEFHITVLYCTNTVH
jgi:hypothetical protein